VGRELVADMARRPEPLSALLERTDIGHPSIQRLAVDSVLRPSETQSQGWGSPLLRGGMLSPPAWPPGTRLWLTRLSTASARLYKTRPSLKNKVLLLYFYCAECSSLVHCVM